MKKLVTSLVLAAVTVSAPVANAEDVMDSLEFSANVALTTDYKFLGYSQTSEGWAIQGGFDVAHESGFYLGTWASTLDYNAAGATDAAQIELDVYGGYGGELSNGLSYDIGFIRYGYPDQNEDAGGGDYEYWEALFSLGYTFSGSLEPSVSAGIAISPDWFGETGTSIYPYFTLDLSLPHSFGVYGKVAYLDVDDINYNYTHYIIGVNKEFMGLTFDLSWNDAEAECDTSGADLCEGFIFAVSKEF